MRLDEAGLDEYTDQFTHDAFRHEILTHYDVATDGGDFARFLAGHQAPSPEVVGPWGRWVQQQLARGATVRRLRILYGPPGDYLRFEMGWVYLANMAAGEDIRILDLTEQPRPPYIIDAEFWMLDGERAVLMTYDDHGRFLYGDTVEGGAAAGITLARDVAWDSAEPFDTWWARHPQYHGPSRASA